jgi:VIT1/CCC1 family predicted Fe2+/Mn2+ transporter
MDEKTTKQVLQFQQDEITGEILYGRLAQVCKDEKNGEVLRKMSEAEGSHYRFWKSISGRDVGPNRGRIFIYYLMARILGLSFALKLMEKLERGGADEYAKFESVISGARNLGEEEESHEASLLGMIEEEHLEYIGSIVLGLNDALVELTGTLAGLTFALQKGRLVAVSGIITGIAAAFSMAASDYLSSRAEGNAKAGKSAIYTGVAYLITVVLLVFPYLILPQTGNWIFASLIITLGIAVLIIFGFNFYLAVAKDLNFKTRFLEMLGISMGVAAFSFLVGLFVRVVFKIEV